MARTAPETIEDLWRRACEAAIAFRTSVAERPAAPRQDYAASLLGRLDPDAEVHGAGVDAVGPVHHLGEPPDDDDRLAGSEALDRLLGHLAWGHQPALEPLRRLAEVARTHRRARVDDLVEELGVGVAGAERRDGDPAAGGLGAQGAGEADDGPLRGRVGRHPRGGHEPGEGGGVEDVAAVGLGEHLVVGGARAVDDTPDVDAERVLPVRIGGLLERTGEEHPGVVDHDVEPPVLGDRRADELTDRFGVADVHGRRARAAERRGRFLRGRAVDVGDHDVAAALDELTGDLEADARPSAGDDADPGLEALARHGPNATRESQPAAPLRLLRAGRPHRVRGTLPRAGRGPARPWERP